MKTKKIKRKKPNPKTELLYIGLISRWLYLVDQGTRDRVLSYLVSKFGSKSSSLRRNHG
jgi:hypothetical protein